MAINQQITLIARQKIGAYLRDIRKHKNLTLQQMADATGIGYKTIQSIEVGSNNYTIDAFLSYINAVDCYFYLADRGDKHLDEEDFLKNIDNPI